MSKVLEKVWHHLWIAPYMGHLLSRSWFFFHLWMNSLIHRFCFIFITETSLCTTWVKICLFNFIFLLTNSMCLFSYFRCNIQQINQLLCHTFKTKWRNPYQNNIFSPVYFKTVCICCSHAIKIIKIVYCYYLFICLFVYFKE